MISGMISSVFPTARRFEMTSLALVTNSFTSERLNMLSLSWMLMSSNLFPLMVMVLSPFLSVCGAPAAGPAGAAGATGCGGTALRASSSLISPSIRSISRSSSPVFCSCSSFSFWKASVWSSTSFRSSSVVSSVISWIAASSSASLLAKSASCPRSSSSSFFFLSSLLLNSNARNAIFILLSVFLTSVPARLPGCACAASRSGSSWHSRKSPCMQGRSQWILHTVSLF